MKLPIFVDTGYFLALINKRDKYHAVARQVSEHVTPPFITSVAILLEVGNALSRPPMRALGVRVLHQIRHNDEIDVVPIDTGLLAAAIDLYESRPDKAWGLTDCTSFVIMQQRGLIEALTADHHFEQAGFVRLLPEN